MPFRKVLGYVRVSTQEQVGGFGLDIQRDAIRAYAKTNHLRLVRVLSDEGVSGSNGLDTRVGLAEALALIERREVSGVVVYRLDRLARDLLLQETLMARTKAAGAEVFSVTEPDIDSEDATRVLVRHVLGAISQYERAVIRGRMAAGKAAKVADGGYGGGRPAFGYVARGGELELDDREQEAVRLARELHAGGLSLRQIGVQLEGAGHSPKVGERWHPNQVRRILERAESA